MEGIIAIALAVSTITTIVLCLAKAAAQFTVETYGHPSNPNFFDEILPWHGMYPTKYLHLLLPCQAKFEDYPKVPAELKKEALKYAKLYIYSLSISVMSAFLLVGMAESRTPN